MNFTKAKLAERYNRSKPTIDRWIANETIPKPDYYINGQANWNEESVQEMDKRLISKEPFQYVSNNAA